MKNLILCLMAFAFLGACKKDSDETTTPSTPTTPTDYYKLQVGNYWVYERWKVDTDGVETNLGFIDSAFVKADTTVNGVTYFDYRCPPSNVFENWVRDSAGYLIKDYGQILCIANTSAGTFGSSYLTNSSDTMADVNYFMSNSLININVAAGNFNCIEMNCAYTFRSPYDTSLNVGPNPKTFKDYYANNIGKVQFSYYYTSTPYRTECRLLRYHVQ